mgnify:CR=1 FL=1
MQIAKLLVDRGAKVDAQDNMGAGPLHRYDAGQLGAAAGRPRGPLTHLVCPGTRSERRRAASLGHVNMVKFLLEQRASVHLLDRGNNTPLCVLSRSNGALSGRPLLTPTLSCARAVLRCAGMRP